MFRNLGLKLLAIFFAVALWSVVAYASNPTQTHGYKLPVAVQGLPSGLVLVGTPPQVSVTAIATADNLHNFTPSELTVSGSFANVRIGKDQVPLRIQNADPTVQVDAPPTVSVQIDQLATASLAVTLVRENALLPGYHEVANSTTITPSTVEVSGPKSRLSGIQAVVPVPLSGLSAPGINGPYSVELLDANKKPVTVPMTITPPQVTVKMVIAADAITVTKPVGFTINGQPAAGYRVTNVQISPLVIEATGLQDALGKIAFLPTDPVDISGQKSDITRTVIIRPPDGIAISQRTATVHVFISAIPGASPAASPSTSP